MCSCQGLRMGGKGGGFHRASWTGIKSPVGTSSGFGMQTPACTLQCEGLPVGSTLTDMGGREKPGVVFVGWFIWCITQDGVSLQHPELRPPPELSILNSCSPSQVSPSIPAAAAAGALLLFLMSHPLCHPQLEGLCSFLQLSSCPEPFLVRFCSWLLVLTPDLSYTSAAILAEQLFLRRVCARAEEVFCSLFPSALSPAPAFSVPRSCPSPSRLPDTSWLPSLRFAPSIPIPSAVCWWLRCCRSQGKVCWAGGRCGSWRGTPALGCCLLGGICHVEQGLGTMEVWGWFFVNAWGWDGRWVYRCLRWSGRAG